ncbi:MAG: MGH1-like glycoside hydrolase domain-containing protein, partial [Janthinobacterium lividum]
IDCPQLKQHIVDRMMQADMFVRNVGLRTLSQASVRFDASSYHNGSIWPHDTGIAAEGMRKHGFCEEANSLIEGLKKVYEHFKTPIELFVSNEHGLAEYSHESGSRACMVQAWSAATMMAASLFGQTLRRNDAINSGHG